MDPAADLEKQLIDEKAPDTDPFHEDEEYIQGLRKRILCCEKSLCMALVRFVVLIAAGVVLFFSNELGLESSLLNLWAFLYIIIAGMYVIVCDVMTGMLVDTMRTCPCISKRMWYRLAVAYACVIFGFGSGIVMTELYRALLQ